MSKEAKVGFWGLLAIIAFLVLVPSRSTRDSDLLNNTFSFVMNEATGMHEKSPVKLAGANVGEIKRIDFIAPADKQLYGDDANIIITVNTDAGVRIPDDSLISVNTMQTGNYWLEITPGFSNTPLKNNSTVRLREIASGNSMAGNVETITKLNKQISAFQGMLSDPKLRTQIRDLASNASFYTNELKLQTEDIGAQQASLNAKLDKLQQNWLEQIERIDLQVSLAEKRLSAMRPRVNESVGAYNKRIQNYRRQIAGMVETAQRETERFQKLSDALGDKVDQVVDNPDFRAKLRKVAHKLDNLAQTSEDIRCITSEPSTREGIKAMVHNYREQSQALKEKLEKWEHRIPGPDPTPAASTTPEVKPTPVEEKPTEPAPVASQQTEASNAEVASDKAAFLENEPAQPSTEAEKNDTEKGSAQTPSAASSAPHE